MKQTNIKNEPLGFRRERRDAEWNVSVSSKRLLSVEEVLRRRAAPLLKGILLRNVTSVRANVGGAFGASLVLVSHVTSQAGCGRKVPHIRATFIDASG